MTCTVHYVVGPPQSGKTTIALGALERLHAQGVPVAYVLPTRDWAIDARRRTKVPCVDWVTAVNVPDRSWRAVAVERADLPEVLWDFGIRSLCESMSAHDGATQLIVVEDRLGTRHKSGPGPG